MSKFKNHLEDFPEDDYYLERMKEILEGYPKLGPLQHPSKLLEHIYMGNQDNADNIDLLQALEITHVLNVAGTRTFDLTRSPYRPNTGIVGFLMIPAEDYEEYDMIQHFMDANIFLDKVKTAGGRALVHCNIGVNRSGAIVAAYLMVHQKRPLLKVTEDLKSKRSLILQNVGFRRQLVRFARCRGLLDLPELPPKKLNFGRFSYTSSAASMETRNTVNIDRNETVKSLTNGTPNNVVEEVAKEPQEQEARGTNDADQPSKEVSGEGTQTSNGNEDKSSSSAPTNTSKYSGQENEDLGNSEERRDKSYSKSSYSDGLDLRKTEDKQEKSDKTFSYSDLGKWEDRRERLLKKVRDVEGSVPLASSSSTTRHLPVLSLSGSSAPLGNSTSSSIYEFDYHPSGNDVVLSALSLELPRYRSGNTIYSNNIGETSYRPKYVQDDYNYSSFRGSRLENPVSLLLLRDSRDTSTSNDDLAPLERSRPVSGQYFESDIFQNKSQDYITPPRVAQKSRSSEKFVSIVKPRSYYQKLIAPNPTSDLALMNGFNSTMNGYGNALEDDLERRSFWKPKPFSNGDGMLFTPYLANNKVSSYSQRHSLSALPNVDILYQPRPYIDKSSIYDPFLLSDYNSSSSYDFPQWKNTGSQSLSYGGRSNYRRTTADYDDALDEYSDLLDASRGKSDAIRAASKSRVRTGKSSGFGRFQAYKY